MSLASLPVDVCRICHCEAEPGSAPLISPCACSGTLRYVHQSCLQQWIKSANTKSCELCKLNFQMTTTVKPFRKVSRHWGNGVEFKVIFVLVILPDILLNASILISDAERSLIFSEFEKILKLDSVNCVPVAEAGDDEGRTTQDLLLSDVPRHRDHVRRLVTLRPH